MSIESGSQTKPEQSPHLVTIPNTIAKQFLAHELGGERNPDRISANDKRWHLYEQAVEVPNIGKALLRVDYRQANYPDENPPERFDQIRFDYIEPDSDEHLRIAEMHWYIEKSESHNPYPFDLMQVHRYVEPKYRDRRGVGRNLYLQSEVWAQQVANEKGKEITLALSTDQPATMKWAEGLGYVPYPEERTRREEIIAHPERFMIVSPETDSAGQERNEAIERDGKRIRIWFTKTLTPTHKD